MKVDRWVFTAPPAGDPPGDTPVTALIAVALETRR
jgi:hypothetical protein